ncbi:MAG TPA: hypothetical protein VLF71_03285 [Candidatus Saccharimonadales bacterium]|nr:hypothetical protein [Candidatus Saccharimonadales bacterium]
MSVTSVEGGPYAGADVAFTAGIYYTGPDPRVDASLLFAERARDAGVPAVFVDGSPQKAPDAHPDWAPTWVADAHRERGAVVLRAEVGGIATQRQQGVKHLVEGGATKVVGVESEKPDVPLYVPELSAALDTADVLVIGRTPESLASMPPVQERTEHLAGWVLEQVHDLPPDTLAGPRGFSAAGAEVLGRYDATDTPEVKKNNWLYLYETPMTARQEGLALGSVALGFKYPPKMVAQETGNPQFDGKRVDQFDMQLAHLLNESRVPQADNPQAVAATVRRTLAQFEGASLETKMRLLEELSAQFGETHGYRPPVRR